MISQQLVISLALLSTQAIAASSRPQVIYGEDSRRDVVSSARYDLLAQATAGRIPKYFLEKTNQGYRTTRSQFLKDQSSTNVCSSERFSEQPTMATCSGFLIAPTLLVTAGHCAVGINEKAVQTKTRNCENHYWMFDFKIDARGGSQTGQVDAKNIYECKQVIFGIFERGRANPEGRLIPGDDFAIIELDRLVESRKPLEIRKTPTQLSESVFMIGHPSGLPLKVSDQAEILENSNPDFFTTNLDSFGGNSGSPVFGSDDKIIGILVRGKPDYVISNEDGRLCKRVNRCDHNRSNCLVNNEVDGEQVTRISKLLPYL